MGPIFPPSFYLVTDRRSTGGRSLLEVLKDALEAGVRLVQLREKDLDTRQLLSLAEACLALTRAYGATLLINDRLDVVQALEADGVHLRADSLPVDVARRILGPRYLIGVSTHSIVEVIAAQQGGADFAVLGPVYETPSKRAFGPPLGLDVLRDACQRSRLPVFAIGGISPNRVPDIIRTGAWGVAGISAVLAAPDVREVVQAFLETVEKTKDSARDPQRHFASRGDRL